MAGAAIVAAAVALAWAAASAEADTWRWPVRGDVLTDFADAAGAYAAGQHRGIDIAASSGTPITAAVGGHVRFAGLVGSSGLTVSVRTVDGRFDISYLHLASASVRAGQAVTSGDRIGAVGASGRRSATAPHLHFGVRDAGTRRYHDPLDLLPPLPGVHDAPRGVPVAVRGRVRVGPAPRPVRVHRFPAAGRDSAPGAANGLAGVRDPASAGVAATDAPAFAATGAAATVAPAGPSRTAWAVACAALILAAALAGGGSTAARHRVRAAAGRLLPSFGGR